MAILNILRYPDPRLHKVAKPVTVFDERLEQLVADMAETMYDAPGIGLAASQVDVHEQLLVIDITEAVDEARHGGWCDALGRGEFEEPRHERLEPLRLLGVVVDALRLERAELGEQAVDTLRQVLLLRGLGLVRAPGLRLGLLRRLALRVAGGEGVFGLQVPHPLRRLETFGEEIHEGGVDVVDRAPDREPAQEGGQEQVERGRRGLGRGLAIPSEIRPCFQMVRATTTVPLPPRFRSNVVM